MFNRYNTSASQYFNILHLSSLLSFIVIQVFSQYSLALLTPYTHPIRLYSIQTVISFTIDILLRIHIKHCNLMMECSIMTKLSKDLIIELSEFLGPRDITSLAATCRSLSDVLTHRLYVNDNKSGRCRALYWSCDCGDRE